MCLCFLDLRDLLYQLKKENEIKRKIDFIASTSLHETKRHNKKQSSFLG